MCFHCIIILSYRVTFFLNVIVQIHYTPESPVRFLFLKKVVKWCKKVEQTKKITEDLTDIVRKNEENALAIKEIMNRFSL